MNFKEIAPKKSLGQNFLLDRNIAAKTIVLLDINPNDTIIEIGPGTGALTSLLTKFDCNLIAVEIDKRAINELNIKFPKNQYPKLNIVNSDIKDFDFNDVYDILQISKTNEINLKVIGNIPYYMSSEILFKLYESKISIISAVMTIQKELAQRLTAKPATKDYGILTLATLMKSKCKIEFDVSPTCFYPIPKVWSSVIKIDFISNNYINENYNSIMKIIRMAFNQRRKMLSNTLKNYTSKVDILLFSENQQIRYNKLMTERPERLNVDDFIFLNKIFTNSP